MKRIGRCCFSILVLVILLACERQSAAGHGSNDRQADSSLGEAKAVQLSTDLENLRNGPPIAAAMFTDDGPGFFQELFVLAMEFAGLSYTVEPAQFSDFFVKDGSIPPEVFSDPDFVYRPDLLERADVYVSDLSVLPWREKILDFVPIIPSRIVFITLRGNELSRVQDLEGKRILSSLGTSYERLLTSIQEEHGVRFELFNVDPGETFADYVVNRTVDASPNDSIYAIRSLRMYPELNISLPMAAYDMLAWGVDPDRPELQRVLNYAVAGLQRNGQFSELLKGFFGMELDEYLRLIAWQPDRSLDADL